MEKHIKLLFLCLSVCLLSACINVSSGIAPSTCLITDKKKCTVVIRNIEGQDLGINILGIPLTSENAYNAVNDAKRKYSIDGLVNVAEENSYLLLFVVNFHDVIVRGDGIKFQT